ncbi:MAG: hypothetical protein AAFN94_06550 [Pseudomonadota bacterium]
MQYIRKFGSGHSAHTVVPRPAAALIDTAQEAALTRWGLSPTFAPATGARTILDAPTLAHLFALRRDLFDDRAYLSLAADVGSFVESCDLTGLQKGYFEDGALIYALRYQYAADLAHNPNYTALWAELYRVAAARDTVLTRFVNASARRGFAAITALFQFTYAFGLAHGDQHSFLTCADGHQRFFARFGFQDISAYHCPHAGAQRIMRLALHDGAHLRTVRSPLYDIWTRHTDTPQETDT